MATENYILGIGPEDGEAAKILKQTNCGAMFAPSAEIFNVLKQKYVQWQKSEHIRPKPDEIKNFSRKHQTKILSEIFNKVVKE